MADIAENPLMNLSEALAERARLARPLVAGIAVPGHRMRSGTLWRKDIVVASEQRFPEVGDAMVTLADGAPSRRALPAAIPAPTSLPYNSTAPPIRRRSRRVSRSLAGSLSPLVPMTVVSR